MHTEQRGVQKKGSTLRAASTFDTPETQDDLMSDEETFAKPLEKVSEVRVVKASQTRDDTASPRLYNTSLKTLLFVLVGLAWIALDTITKQQFETIDPGSVVATEVGGLFNVRLVHNTGAAWGIFADATFALGVFSVIVCAVLVVYFFFNAKRLTMLETCGLALIVAGGFGNALDRFILGYVVDFIEFSFFDFPVFNVADIGVTGGLVLVILGVVKTSLRDRRTVS